uniref:Protein-tyrosine-phosphatase n=1 Tax=Globodera pallida TaxID=36090 RepID=A0A183CJK0_GLOPA
TAYLLTKNGSLFALDLNRGIESNLELTTGCLRQKTITSIVGEFVWNKAASPQLYALTWNGLIELKLNSDNNCPDINVNWSLFGETGLKAISLFTVADKVLVFATPNDLLVYDRQTAAVSQFPSPSPPIRQLLAVSQSSQPFPNRDCFQLPPASQISFNVKNEGRTGAVVEVHELQLQKDAQQQQPNECVNVSQPITQYDVHFRKRGTDKHQQEKIKTVHSSSNRIVVDNGVLEKYTDYDVTVSWLNHYCPPQGQSETKLLHTGFGYPSAPKEPKALALTPDTVLLSWTLPDLLSAPVAEIRYRKDAQQQQPNECVNVSQPITQYDVHFRKRGTDKHQQEKIKTVHSSSNRIVVDNGVLEKYTDYDVTVSWLNHYCPPQGQSETKLLHTGFGYPSAPKEPKALALTPDTVLLSWTLPDLLSAPVAEIRYRVTQLSPALANPVPVAVRPAEGTAGHFSAALAEVVPCESNPCQAKVPNLRPSTDYHFWVVALHINRLNADDAEATSTESQAHTRDIPGTLRLENVTSDSMFLRWNTLMSGVDASSAQFVQISIQYRQSGVDASWTDVRNSTFALTDWPQRFLCVDQLHPATAYDYRYAAEYTIFAANVWAGAASTAATASSVVDGKAAQQQLQLQQKDGGKKAVLIETFFQQSQQARTKAGTPSTPLDVKLANEQSCAYDATTKQSDWPTGKCEGGGWTLRWAEPNFDGGEPIQNYAVEYRASGQTEWEIAERGLPPDRLFWRVAWTETHARRGKTPSDEELAQGYRCSRCCCWLVVPHVDTFPQSSHKFSPEVQNELKTLPRLSAECVKATKELGMGSFGRVCEGEQFLVLELMDGGDMRNFLRQSRPYRNRPSRVSLRELIAMIVDVGRGCVYLEKYKHVHRDLAARNCLISSTTSLQRVTKIADFGHARELFVDDYYRFRGGDLLPLRWLSPEVINQGLFTSKSDVWAFGVLLWEIVTLGEQPFAHMSNTQVLARLSSGMSLDRPTDCPNELHDVMKATWTVDAEKRPQFADMQPRLETMRGLPTFQSRDPFPPPSSSDNFFDASQNSSTSKGELSSTTTTNGDGDSSTACQFDKSGESFSRRRNAKRSRHTIPRRTSAETSMGGGPSASYSFATASTGLESSEYEVPKSRAGLMMNMPELRTSKGELSSTTTTNGDGDSSACQFDKSGESFSGRRNAKRSRHTIPRRTSTETSMGGGPSASYSFATASTGLESSEYEVPKSRAGLMMNMPELRHTNHRRSTGFHQNDAFVGDSSVEDAGERFTQSISLAGTSRAVDEPLTTPFRQQFGASSSRVSRV